MVRTMSETVERSSLDLRFEGYRLRDEAAEARLLASISERGIEEPLGGVDTPQGRVLLDGFRRNRCAAKLGLECVPYVSWGTDETLGIASLLGEQKGTGVVSSPPTKRPPSPFHFPEPALTVEPASELPSPAGDPAAPVAPEEPHDENDEQKGTNKRGRGSFPAHRRNDPRPLFIFVLPPGGSKALRAKLVERTEQWPWSGLGRGLHRARGWLLPPRPVGRPRGWGERVHTAPPEERTRQFAGVRAARSSIRFGRLEGDHRRAPRFHLARTRPPAQGA